MRSVLATLAGPTCLAVALALTGCLASDVPYRPYKGEPHPAPGPQPDPIRDEVELKWGVPHYVDEDSSFIAETRREQSAVYEHVYKNDDGTKRNAWQAYAKDMNRTLGAGTVREAPEPKSLDEQMLRRSEGGAEGGGDKGGGDAKPDKGGDAMGGDKPAEGDKKE
jgi:hypothetical protein